MHAYCYSVVSGSVMLARNRSDWEFPGPWRCEKCRNRQKDETGGLEVLQGEGARQNRFYSVKQNLTSVD